MINYNKYKIKKKTSYYGWGGYNPSSGSFSTVSLRGNSLYINDWQHCRESFSINFTKQTRFLAIYHDSKSGNRIANFLNEAEKRLKVKPLSEVYGDLTGDLGGKVSVIKLSPWWGENSVRRQFLTILLRAGRRYSKSFDNALYSEGYFRRTKDAVEKFFKGYTKYRGGFSGWVTTFRNGGYQAKSLERRIKKLKKQLAAAKTNNTSNLIK